MSGFCKEDLIMTKYIVEGERQHLSAGEHATAETSRIFSWKELNRINIITLKGYNSFIKRFSNRGFLEIVATYRANSPTEYKIVQQIYDGMRNMSSASKEKINKLISECMIKES